MYLALNRLIFVDIENQSPRVFWIKLLMSCKNLYIFSNKKKTTCQRSCILGNKQDREEERQVAYTQAREFSEQAGMLECIETSARENTNIDTVFITMAKVCL